MILDDVVSDVGQPEVDKHLMELGVEHCSIGYAAIHKPRLLAWAF